VLRAKRSAAIGQARIGLQVARSVLADVDTVTSAAVAEAQSTISSTLTASGTSAGLFTTVSCRHRGQLASRVSPVAAQHSAAGQPRRAVREGAAIRQRNSRLVNGLVVGEPVDARTGVFELYYLFPLTSRRTRSALSADVLIAGLALVLLVLVIALLVTRQVVAPVRVAAEAAVCSLEVISHSGCRCEAPTTSPARRSFNEMAGPERQIRRLEDLSRLQRRLPATSPMSCARR